MEKRKRGIVRRKREARTIKPNKQQTKQKKQQKKTTTTIKHKQNDTNTKKTRMS